MIDRQLNLNDIEAAAKQLKNIAVNTPLQFSERLSELYGASIYIKREDLQRCRSFKVRKLYNKIISLPANVQKRHCLCQCRQPRTRRCI